MFLNLTWRWEQTRQILKYKYPEATAIKLRDLLTGQNLKTSRKQEMAFIPTEVLRCQWGMFIRFQLFTNSDIGEMRYNQVKWVERSYGKSFVSQWKILAIFSSFIAYETVDEFVTSCENPVASQPSLLFRDETMNRSFLVSLPSTTFAMLKRGLDPLLPSLLSYLRTSTIFYNVEHFSLFLIMLIKQLRQLRSIV